MKEAILALCEHVAPAGQEGWLQQTLLQTVADVADETLIDALGNAIASKHGAGPHIMLTAHADEAGLMVIDIDAHGFARVIAIGDIAAQTLLGRHVRFSNGVAGIIGVESGVKAADIGFEHLYVDVGADSLELARQRVRIGLSGVVVEPVMELGAGRLAGRALDNRVGCAIVADAFRQLAAQGRRVSVAFTALHEPGARGAKTAAFRLRPDIAFVVDAAACGDMPEAARMAIRLGGGPVIKVMDGTAVIAPAIQARVEEAAQAAGLQPQHEVAPRGRSDAGAIQRSQEGVHVAGIGYPARYVGGPSVLVDMVDIEQTVRLLVQAAESYAVNPAK